MGALAPGSHQLRSLGPPAGINTSDPGGLGSTRESWLGGVARLLQVTVTLACSQTAVSAVISASAALGAAAHREGALPQYLCQALSRVLVPNDIRRQGTETFRNQPQPVEEPRAMPSPDLPLCEDLLNTQTALKYQLNHKNH